MEDISKKKTTFEVEKRFHWCMRKIALEENITVPKAYNKVIKFGLENMYKKYFEEAKEKI